MTKTELQAVIRLDRIAKLEIEIGWDSSTYCNIHFMSYLQLEPWCLFLPENDDLTTHECTNNLGCTTKLQLLVYLVVSRAHAWGKKIDVAWKATEPCFKTAINDVTQQVTDNTTEGQQRFYLWKQGVEQYRRASGTGAGLAHAGSFQPSSARESGEQASNSEPMSVSPQRRDSSIVNPNGSFRRVGLIIAHMSIYGNNH